VNLSIDGVAAQLQLVARLGNIVTVVNRALDTIDRNPNLLTVS
jgi:hypothetical protein